MIVPELPGYLTSLGGEDYKGLIISLFTLTAGLSRPFSGKLADTIGRIPVMIFGAAICFAIGFLYPVMSSVSGFLLLRFFHGFSTGFKPTGTTAYVADIVADNRRGEAMGILGMMGSLGMASGPSVGSLIAIHYGLDTMFYSSSFTAIFSVLVLVGMKETLPNKQRMNVRLLKITRKDVLEPRVLVPSLIMMLTVVSFGAILTIIPDYSEFLGVKNKGLFFTFFTIASLAVRVLGGKASDKYGRRHVLKVAALGMGVSMICIGLSTTPFQFFASAVLFGLAVGLNTPSIFAWTIDLSDEQHRGRAMATVYIALEIGIGAGALLSGWLYGNISERFPITFFVCGGFAIAAFLYLVFLLPSKYKKKVE